MRATSSKPLKGDWERVKDSSRLSWDKAKDATRDAWHRIERVLPGDAGTRAISNRGR